QPDVGVALVRVAVDARDRVRDPLPVGRALRVADVAQAVEVVDRQRTSVGGARRQGRPEDGREEDEDRARGGASEATGPAWMAHGTSLERGAMLPRVSGLERGCGSGLPRSRLEDDVAAARVHVDADASVAAAVADDLALPHDRLG